MKIILTILGVLFTVNGALVMFTNQDNYWFFIGMFNIVIWPLIIYNEWDK